MTSRLKALQLIHLVAYLAAMPIIVAAIWVESMTPLAMVAFAHWAVAWLALKAERLGL